MPPVIRLLFRVYYLKGGAAYIRDWADADVALAANDPAVMPFVVKRRVLFICENFRGECVAGDYAGTSLSITRSFSCWRKMPCHIAQASLSKEFSTIGTS